jgi:MinD superfamily P-loop ATPase
MKIAIASGKGGTGKTTISVNLACVAGEDVQLVDCDVEEPNAHLFLKARRVATEVEGILTPQIDEKQCDGCGECASFCEFNALAALGGAPLVFPELCHGCGGCARVCPQGAIAEVERRIGTVDTSVSGLIQLVGGCLDVGMAMAPPLINAVKKRVWKQGLVILDAPPGTTCPVVAALNDVDYVVLVTEPTPFGLNDLKLAVDMVRALNLPFGVVINRAGSGNADVMDYCRSEEIVILMEIPDDRRIAQVYSRGELIVESLPEYKGAFRLLLDKIIKGGTIVGEN